ncbi:MAG: zf-TFIIB domain-containing protein [Myxococcales bacterium]|nr:zf-TFIIB domain-containing protein [Myxococcales bacterium]
MTSVPTPPKCPRCKTALMADNISNHGVVHNAWSCEACKGFWISLEQLTQLEMQERARLFELRILPPKELQDSPLDCPQCGKHLEKVKSTRDEHVTMDVCGACQKVWLDKGELEAIRTESLASLVAQLVRLLREARGN